jgi:hypothetical protein
MPLAHTEYSDYAEPRQYGIGHREGGSEGEVWHGQRGPLGFGIPGVKPRYRVPAPVVRTNAARTTGET